ncbi:MAG: MBL fold metallo-hydrolase [Pirellulaceae bacterium]
MDVISLQSGSNGNAFFVKAGGVQLLVDAGISGRQAELRLAEHGFDIRDTNALLISHDHRDHAQNLGIYHRKFGMPVYLTGRTFEAARRWCNLGRVDRIRWFVSGETLQIEDVTVHTIPTPHDGADGVAFVIEHENKRVGILSDLGHAFDGLRDVLRELDAVVIESNYDEDMLHHGPYPEHLKRRIRGPGGHLSNDDSAELVQCGNGRLQWACLCHLSEENNTPELARTAHTNILGPHFKIHVAPRYSSSEKLRIE